MYRSRAYAWKTGGPKPTTCHQGAAVALSQSASRVSELQVIVIRGPYDLVVPLVDVATEGEERDPQAA